MDRRRFLATAPAVVPAAAVATSLIAAPTLAGDFSLPFSKFVRPARKELIIPGRTPPAIPGVLSRDGSASHLRKHWLYFGEHQRAKLQELRGPEVARLYDRYVNSQIICLLENKAFLLPLPVRRLDELDPLVATNFVSFKHEHWISNCAIRFAGSPDLLNEPLAELYEHGYVYYNDLMLPILRGADEVELLRNMEKLVVAAPACPQKFHPKLTMACYRNPHVYKHVPAYIPRESMIRTSDADGWENRFIFGRVDIYAGFCLTNDYSCSIGRHNSRLWLLPETATLKTSQLEPEERVNVRGLGDLCHDKYRPSGEMSFQEAPFFVNQDEMDEFYAEEDEKTRVEIERKREILNSAWAPKPTAATSSILELNLSSCPKDC